MTTNKVPAPKASARDSLLGTFLNPGVPYDEMSEVSCYQKPATGQVELRWNGPAEAPKLIRDEYDGDVAAAKEDLRRLTKIENRILGYLWVALFATVGSMVMVFSSGSLLWFLLGLLSIPSAVAIEKDQKSGRQVRRSELRLALQQMGGETRRHLPLPKDVAPVVSAALEEDREAALSAMKLMGKDYSEDIRRRAATALLQLQGSRARALEAAGRGKALEGEQELAYLEATVGVKTTWPTPAALE